MCRARPARARRPVLRGVGAVGAVVLVLLVGPDPVVVQRVGQLVAHGFAHGVHALWVDHGELFGDVGLAGQG